MHNTKLMYTAVAGKTHWNTDFVASVSRGWNSYNYFSV